MALSDRVLYARTGGLALQAPHEQLGADYGGVWVAMSAAAQLGLVEHALPHRMLWFERASYEQAVRALPPEETTRAVHFRLDNWSPSAAGRALGQVMRSEWRLTLALARAGRRADAERSLARLTRFAGDGAWDRTAIPDQLERCVEEAARLAAALGGEPAPGGEPVGADAERARAVQLAERLAARGRPEYATALPYVAIERVYAAPASPGLLTILENRYLEHATIDARLLFPWAADRIAELRIEARMIHPDRGAFIDLLEQTPAQRERDLGELLGRDAGWLAAQARELLLLWRRDALLRLAYLQRRAPDETLLAAQAQVRRDELLAEIGAGGGDQTAVAPALGALRDDLAMARLMAARAHLTDLAARAAGALTQLDQTMPDRTTKDG